MPWRSARTGGRWCDGLSVFGQEAPEAGVCRPFNHLRGMLRQRMLIAKQIFRRKYSRKHRGHRIDESGWKTRRQAKTGRCLSGVDGGMSPMAEEFEGGGIAAPDSARMARRQA